MKKRNNLILICVIIFGITLILIAFFLILNEIESAKEFCNSINGNYSFSNLRHECNGKSFFQYTSLFFEEYWDFTPRENFNITLPK